MLQVDRINLILQLLQENESVSVSDLSARFSVSNETIRRDLDKLCTMDSRICRAHGGAYMAVPNTDPPYQLRRVSLIEGKKRMAAACFPLIASGDCIMIDCSTTALQLIELLTKSSGKYTVITNGFDVIQEVASCKNINLVCIGGQFDYVSCSFVGNTALSVLSVYHADKCFISCSGISSDFGITDNSEDQAAIRRLMLQHSSTRILLADASKFDKSKTHSIGKLCDIDYLYTDVLPENMWRAALEDSGVKLHVSN